MLENIVKINDFPCNPSVLHLRILFKILITTPRPLVAWLIFLTKIFLRLPWVVVLHSHQILIPQIISQIMSSLPITSSTHMPSLVSRMTLASALLTMNSQTMVLESVPRPLFFTAGNVSRHHDKGTPKQSLL